MIQDMPDTRTHRGAHPDDAKLFAEENIADLHSAVEDFSLFLTKGYADKSALKLVGDRFELTKRQRLAVSRNSCSDQQLKSRRKSSVAQIELYDRTLAIDGYNILITIEAALGQGLIFIGRDRVCRDLASIHGTYKKVEETVPAVELIGTFIEETGVAKVEWLLDSPVSNSGRLKTLLEEIAGSNGWPWDVRLVKNPDPELIESPHVVASSDSVVLDQCASWVNLARDIIELKMRGAIVIDLS